jgi:hypothetical protein
MPCPGPPHNKNHNRANKDQTMAPETGAASQGGTDRNPRPGFSLGRMGRLLLAPALAFLIPLCAAMTAAIT